MVRTAGGSRVFGAALRVLVLGAALPVLVGAAEVQTPKSDPTPDIMGEFVEAFRVVLPPSLSSEKFADPARRGEILAALKVLSANSGRLDRHAANGESGFAFLSYSLARDIRDIEQRFAAGRTDEARFMLHHVTEVCVACHSQLPDREERPLGHELFEAEALASLPPEERVQFEMATRQFDAALASFESLFANPDVSPADIDLSGYADNYLELCLRVQHDPKRATRTLERLAAREDLPKLQRDNVKAWIGSLEDLDEEAPEADVLEEAKKLLARAEDRGKYPDERQGLVFYVAASGLLHRFVATQTEASADLGQAYYLLGVIESNIGRSFWASQTELFLETAIRIGPGEPYAEPALALLEEFIVAGYTGSAGTHVPPEVRARLDELEELIAAAQPDPG